MKTDKMVVATLVSIALFVLLMGWAFYQALQLDSDHKIKLENYAQKAVTAQAPSMNETRLEQLAQSGKVIKGMTMKHVRLALGEPERTEQEERDGEQVTIWWYEHEKWKRVVFDCNGLVVRMDKQP